MHRNSLWCTWKVSLGGWPYRAEHVQPLAKLVVAYFDRSSYVSLAVCASYHYSILLAGKQTNQQIGQQTNNIKQPTNQQTNKLKKTKKGLKPLQPSCHHLVLPRDPSPHSLRCPLYAGNTPALSGKPIHPRCRDGSGGPTNPQCDAWTWHRGCLKTGMVRWWKMPLPSGKLT